MVLAVEHYSKCQEISINELTKSSQPAVNLISSQPSSVEDKFLKEVVMSIYVLSAIEPLRLADLTFSGHVV